MTPRLLALLVLLIISAGCGPVVTKLLPVGSAPTALPAAAATARPATTPSSTPAPAGATPTRTAPAPPAPALTNSDDAIRLAQQKYPALKGIQKRAAGSIGASVDIMVQERAGGWNLIFWQGSGDCPAGCINNHYWYVAVESVGSANMQGEYVRAYDSTSNSVKISGAPLWGIPPP